MKDQEFITEEELVRSFELAQKVCDLFIGETLTIVQLTLSRVLDLITRETPARLKDIVDMTEQLNKINEGMGHVKTAPLAKDGN